MRSDEGERGLRLLLPLIAFMGYLLCVMGYELLIYAYDPTTTYRIAARRHC